MRVGRRAGRATSHNSNGQQARNKDDPGGTRVAAAASFAPSDGRVGASTTDTAASDRPDYAAFRLAAPADAARQTRFQYAATVAPLDRQIAATVGRRDRPPSEQARLSIVGGGVDGDGGDGGARCQQQHQLEGDDGDCDYLPRHEAVAKRAGVPPPDDESIRDDGRRVAQRDIA
uniref:Uncharacterized protein n=1 Tax=Plectus sambesii TaxID=2011161 RepID=A0A914VWF3_9BILA